MRIWIWNFSPSLTNFLVFLTIFLQMNYSKAIKNKWRFLIISWNFESMLKFWFNVLLRQLKRRGMPIDSKKEYFLKNRVNKKKRRRDNWWPSSSSRLSFHDRKMELIRGKWNCTRESGVGPKKNSYKLEYQQAPITPHFAVFVLIFFLEFFFTTFSLFLFSHLRSHHPNIGRYLSSMCFFFQLACC